MNNNNNNYNNTRLTSLPPQEAFPLITGTVPQSYGVMVTYNMASNYFQSSSKCQPLSSSFCRLVVCLFKIIKLCEKLLKNAKFNAIGCRAGGYFFASLVSTPVCSQVEPRTQQIVSGGRMMYGLHSLWLCRDYLCC